MKLTQSTDLKHFASSPYMTEHNLGVHVSRAFGEPKETTTRFSFDKSIPNSGLRTRPDIYDKLTNRIWEFDGDSHYTSSSVQTRDSIKLKVYSGVMGIKVLSIPYFVQLSSTTSKPLFDLEWSPEHDYVFPHGFIGKKCLLPADFNSIGIDKFINDLVRLHAIKARNGSHISVATEVLQSMWLRNSSYGESDEEVFFDTSWKHNGEFEFPTNDECTSFILGLR